MACSNEYCICCAEAFLERIDYEDRIACMMVDYRELEDHLKAKEAEIQYLRTYCEG